jgi:penicillin amidase
VRGRAEPEVLEVLETRHGPLMDSYLIGVGDPEVVPGGVRHTCALRWVGTEYGIEPSTVFELNTAGSWEDFRAAVHEAWQRPGQNMVYADVDGNIGYQLTGLYPIRRSGDGTVPVPGWTDEYEWEGWIPFDDLPRAFNPEDGFLCTANNKMHDEGYPDMIGRDFLPPHRARRIAQLLTERERHTRGTFAAMQTDTRSLPAAVIVPHLVRVEPGDERQKEAIALLAEWDHDLREDSAGAAIYEVWCHHVALRVLGHLLRDEALLAHLYGRRQWTNAFQYQVLPNLLEYPTARWFGRNGVEARNEVLREALDRALNELTGRLGEDVAAWRWGALHRARFRSRLAMVSPDLFSAGEVEMGGDEQTVLQAMFEPGSSYDVVVTASWRQIVDLSDWTRPLGPTLPASPGTPPARTGRTSCRFGRPGSTTPCRSGERPWRRPSGSRSAWCRAPSSALVGHPAGWRLLPPSERHRESPVPEHQGRHDGPEHHVPHRFHHPSMLLVARLGNRSGLHARSVERGQAEYLVEHEEQREQRGHRDREDQDPVHDRQDRVPGLEPP